MPRYIDADRFIERLNASPAFPNMGTDGYFLLGVVENLLKSFPTADVVPKSEVERLYYNLQAVLEERAETKREIAREIFDEIYEDCFDQFGYIDYEKLAELKKKYTEDKV